MKHIISNKTIIDTCSCGCRFMYDESDCEVKYASVYKYVKCPKCGKLMPTEILRNDKQIPKEEWNVIKTKQLEYLKNLKEEN